MDEITLLASSLPDAPPPAPEVVARARARLAAQKVRRRPRPTWTLIIGAATATAAVITAVALSATLLTPAPAPVPVPLTPKSGAGLLLELADRVQRLPAENGAYWMKRTLYMQPVLVGTGSARYWIGSETDTREWTPGEPGALNVIESQWTGYRPLTSEDRRIWRDQGSPKQWKVPGECENSKTSGCGWQILKSGDASSRTFRFPASTDGVFGDRSVSAFTLADLEALPTDTALLKQRLAKYHAVWVKRGFKDPFEKFLGWAVPNMLKMPVPSGVRAALLRLYAKSPGGVSVREIVDPLGRAAVAVDPRDNKQEEITQIKLGDRMVPITRETVLDPLTGAYLGERFTTVRAEDGFPKGTVLRYAAVSEVGWTDKRPLLPPGCRPKAGSTCR